MPPCPISSRSFRFRKNWFARKKLTPDTETGQHLQYSPNQLLKTLDNKERTTISLDPAQIASIRVEIKALQIPLSQRVSRFFDERAGILNGLRGWRLEICNSAPSSQPIRGES